MTALLNIQSSIQNYSVYVVENALEHIEKELCNGAFIIIDENIYNLYYSESILKKFQGTLRLRYQFRKI